jgi:hypothetical protein
VVVERKKLAPEQKELVLAWREYNLREIAQDAAKAEERLQARGVRRGDPLDRSVAKNRRVIRDPRGLS